MKAIITAGGWGTRRLPITKAIDKSMLPIGNRPIVDYVVEDCLKAGITEIIFIVSEGSSQLQSYYGRNKALEDYLRDNGKDDELKQVLPLGGITFHYVEQPNNNKYGTAIPISLAVKKHDLKDGAVVLMGDDFVYHEDGQSEVAKLIEEAGQESSLLGVEVDIKRTHIYGVHRVSKEGNLQSIVEKPKAGTAPSNLINISKYVMSQKLLNYIVTYCEEDIDGEYMITEPINRYCKDGGIIKVVHATGQYLDGGTLEGWLEANRTVCK
jgi:UTP--glucose-1-phosphate uridylyltransferase